MAGSRQQCTKHWISACPARDVRETARPASTWPRTSRRCCDHSYRRKIRPRSHYALGWLPRWGRLITRARASVGPDQCEHGNPWGPNAPPLGRGYRPATLAAEVRLGRGAQDGLRFLSRQVIRRSCGSTPSPTASLETPIGAAVSVLAAAGYAPQLVERPACCGLTWISTGQLDGARRQLRAALDILHPYVVGGNAGGRPGTLLPRGLAQ